MYPSHGIFLGGSSDKESACQCRRYRRLGFDPWVEKIPKRMSWQLAPVFLDCKIPWSEEPCGLQSMGLQRVEATEHAPDTHPSHTYLRRSPKL